MKVTLSCPWCEEAGETRKGSGKVYCWSCGHRADVPRAECDCRKCRTMSRPNSIARKAEQFREAS